MLYEKNFLGTNLIDTGPPGFLADHPAGETGALKNRKVSLNQKDRYDPMNKTIFAAVLLLSGSIFTTGSVQAQTVMSVSYGTITGINQQERSTSGGAAAGAIVGGLVGLASGSGRSRSNQALRTLGGTAVGSAAGGAMARGTEIVYTVSLLNGGTVRVIMDSSNFHRGDCVAVEQGGPHTRAIQGRAAGRSRPMRPSQTAVTGGPKRRGSQDCGNGDEHPLRELRFRLDCLLRPISSTERT